MLFPSWPLRLWRAARRTLAVAPAVLLSVLTACGAQPKAVPKPRQVADEVQLIGRIQHPLLTESSGVVVSRTNPAVFWTHNDGGGKRQVLYAMTRTGAPIAEYRVTGALLEDWEDIATDGQGHLFLADTGNNDVKRQSVAVYQVDEPDTAVAKKGLARVTHSWRLLYPKAPFDCEAMIVWNGNGYLISKVFDDERADIYRFSLTNAAPAQTLEIVGEIKIESPVTGADLSADGKLLAVVAKNGAYVFRVDGEPWRASKGKPAQTKFKHEHVEACTFVPEGLLVTAESREIYLFTDEALRTGPVNAAAGCPDRLGLGP